MVVAAHVIIGAASRTVYTRNPATNSYVSASLDPISSPATDVAVIFSSALGDEPSSLSSSVPATLEPSTPTSALAAHEPSDALLSPLSHLVLTNLHPLSRPSPLVCRLLIQTPQTLTFQSTFGFSFSRLCGRLTYHRPWPPISGTSSSLIKMFSPGHRPTLVFATYCS